MTNYNQKQPYGLQRREHTLINSLKLLWIVLQYVYFNNVNSSINLCSEYSQLNNLDFFSKYSAI